MNIHYDSKGNETITFTANETRKLRATVRLLTSLARSTADDALWNAIKLLKDRVPLADPEKELKVEE